MQLYKHNTSRDCTHKQAGGRSVDAALFAEELAKIYISPTPNAMAKARNVVLIECSLFFTMAGGLYLYPGQIRVLKGLA